MNPLAPAAPAPQAGPRRDFSVVFDLGPVLVLTVGALWSVRPDDRLSDYVGLVLVVLPLLGRRFWPFASLALVAAATVLNAHSFGIPWVQVTSVALASESVGQYGRGRSTTAILVLLVAGLMALGLIAQDADAMLSIVLPFVIVVPSWIVGDTIRSRGLEEAARIETAERSLREREARLAGAAAEERRHVARELHDVVAHSVSVMLIQAGAARQVVRTSPDRAEEALLAVEATGREAMRELRRLLGVLGDDGLDEPVDSGGVAPQPGVDHLGTLVDRIRAAGLPAELEVDGESRALPTSLDVTVYRIVQEALTNALRYAGRARTIVHLTYEPAQLRVEVLDDGPGGATDRGDGSGRGLTGMRERASLSGGRLEAGPRLGGGYAVRAWLPLPPEPS
jgi:signal transduction histidine kinase